MKHLPNLLKQESSSASTLVHVLVRMYYDPRPEHQTARPQIADRLLPFVFILCFSYFLLISSPLYLRLGLGVIQDYNKLRPDTQGKNIIAWTPVVAEILEGFCRFDEKAVCSLPLQHPSCSAHLTMTVVLKISPSDIPTCDRAISSGHSPRSSAKSENLFYKSGICTGDHRGFVIIFHVLYSSIVLSVIRGIMHSSLIKFK